MAVVPANAVRSAEVAGRSTMARSRQKIQGSELKYARDSDNAKLGCSMQMAVRVAPVARYVFT